LITGIFKLEFNFL